MENHNQQYVLRISKAGGPWEERPLEFGEFILGRSDDCSICLAEANVSRRHAQLSVGADGCWIMDLGSANGSKLDDRPLPANKKKPLATGQVVALGSFRLMVEVVKPEQEKALSEQPPEASFNEQATKLEAPEEEVPPPPPVISPSQAATQVEVPESAPPVSFKQAETKVEAPPSPPPVAFGEAATRAEVPVEAPPPPKMDQVATRVETPAVPPVQPSFDQQATRAEVAMEIPAARPPGKPAEQAGPPVKGAGTGLRLRYRMGNEPWQQKDLEYREYVIGRMSECDIPVADLNISRRHARLDITPQGCFVMDLGSANGTLLENGPLFPRVKTPLQPGKLVTLANYYFVVEDVKKGLPPSFEEKTRQAAAVVEEATRVAASRPSFIIRYRQGSSAWQEYMVGQGDQFIGRGSDCQLRVDSRSVSRHHARLTIRPDGLWIEDLGSTNGILIKGQRIPALQSYPLTHGVIFQIEDFQFEVVVPGAAPAQGGATVATVVSGAPLVGASPDGATMVVDAAALVAAEEFNAPLNLLGHEKISIGRGPDNQVVLNHPMVSRFHAMIERMGTRSRLVDLHSANGVFINGQPVKEAAWLNPGDLIKVGPYQLHFTGNELRPSAVESYSIDVIGMNKWVTKKLNLLQDITLNIGQNEFVALVGMSGAGKSTLMDAINGFRPATHGRVLVNGVDLYQNYGMFRDDIGNVPQKDIVHFELTGEQALDYAAQLRMPADTGREERRRAVHETLDDLDLTFRKDVPISKLSGGQLKRVSIGVELLTKPRLFFLDEPTSGLDPGTEYEMMKLLRRLADQGRTIMIITHATKNVMFCDKAIILARGGNVAYYGPPEYALEYFDTFRTKRERLEKDMEFDDIYRILQDPERGKPEEWRERYLKSKYAKYVQPKFSQAAVAQPPAGAGRAQRGRRIGMLKQFFILSARTLKCMVQDKTTLGLTLALAPVLGLVNFMWGRNLFDPVTGDSAKVMAMWFIMSIIAVLVGAMGSMREIVKENDIYKRERAVGLKVLPYILSKMWIGFALAIYQGTVILLIVLMLVNPAVSSLTGYLGLLITIILGIICGYMLGLVISAGVPNQNSAQILLIAVLVPQFLFAGVLQPLQKIPLGEIISPFISSRWVFESFVKSTGMGDTLSSDACWSLPKDQRNALSETDKDVCLCMGPQIFQNCGSMPGVKSKDFYTEAAQVALAQPEPEQPVQPTRIPSPTPRMTPTLLATPTYLYTPTYLPTPTPPNTPTPVPPNYYVNMDYITGGTTQPENYDEEVEKRAYAYAQAKANAYQKTREAQFVSYSKTREAQIVDYGHGEETAVAEYRTDMEGQVSVYRDDVEVQINNFVEVEREGMIEYANSAEGQVTGFIQDLSDYGAEKEQWKTTRQEAIASAEAILGIVYDDYGRAFQGSVILRWFAIIVISFLFFIAILIFQKRKDAV